MTALRRLTGWDLTLSVSDSRTEFPRVTGTRKRTRQKKLWSIDNSRGTPLAELVKCQPTAKMVVKDTPW